MTILEQIILKRKKDIEKNGINFGLSIPVTRNRKVSPFLQDKGVILEIKRASPSKGEISLNLDSFKTTSLYMEGGASAISVLTEQNYFKGSLLDLVNACKSVDSLSEKTGKLPSAILRKDFLLFPEEVELSYKFGADAVLLIARILSDDVLLKMLQKCQELGITALLELRTNDDLRKLSVVSSSIKTSTFACGVNSRDLSDFSIDFLQPVKMMTQIKKIAGDDVRIIFESGIKTPESASFVGSLGFTGMLLGEAAAKKPENAKSLVEGFLNSKETSNAKKWISFSNIQKKLPLVKICGITNPTDALNAAKLGADFLGFVFYKGSPRNTNGKIIREIKREFEINKIKCPFLCGVITDISSTESLEAINLAKDGVIDFIQLHGCSTDFINSDNLHNIPHYPVVNITTELDISKIDNLLEIGESRILIDSKTVNKIGGTGQLIEKLFVEKIKHKTKIWIAGGINSQNVNQIIESYHPELIDISSGIESSEGIKDFSKMKSLFENINNATK